MEEFDLEKALAAISQRITPEMREEERLAQAGLMEVIAPHIANDSFEQRVARAIEQEKSLLEQIAYLAGEEDGEVKQNRLYTLLNRLSEVLAEQGRFDDAIEVCPEAVRRAHYQMLLEAVRVPDQQMCECPPDQITDALSRTTVSDRAQMEVETVVTQNGLRTLTVCRKCGFKNAK